MDRTLNFRQPQIVNVDKILSRTSKIFFALNLIQVVVVGSLQSTMMIVGDYSAVKSGGMGPGRRVYMSLFTGAVIYSCFLCLFAVRKENFLEIIAFVMQNFGYIAYSFIQVYHIFYKEYQGTKFKKDKNLGFLSIINCCSLILLNSLFTFLAFKLFKEYGWKIYKRVRFNINLRGAYHLYELVICLMKMLLMFVTMFCLCFNRTILRVSESSSYFALTIAVMPITMLFCVTTVIAIRREWKVYMVTFIMILCATMGIFIYQINSVITVTCHGCMNFFKMSIDIPEEVVIHLLYLASVALFFTLLLFVATIKVTMNFGKGLRNHFAGETRHSSALLLGLSGNFMNSLFLSSSLEKNKVYNEEDTSRDRYRNIVNQEDRYRNNVNQESGSTHKDNKLHKYLKTSLSKESDGSSSHPTSNGIYSRHDSDDVFIISRDSMSFDSSINENRHDLSHEDHLIIGADQLTNHNEFLSSSLPTRPPNEQRVSVMTRLSNDASERLNNLFIRREISQESTSETSCCFFYRKKKTRHESNKYHLSLFQESQKPCRTRDSDSSETIIINKSYNDLDINNSEDNFKTTVFPINGTGIQNRAFSVQEDTIFEESDENTSRHSDNEIKTIDVISILSDTKRSFDREKSNSLNFIDTLPSGNSELNDQIIQRSRSQSLTNIPIQFNVDTLDSSSSFC